DGHASLRVPNNPARPAQSLEIEISPRHAKNSRLVIVINGRPVFEGTLDNITRSWKKTIALDAFFDAPWLTIEIDSDTFSPKEATEANPKILGVQILRLALTRAVN